MPRVMTQRGEMWIADHRRQHDVPAAFFIHGAGGSHLSFPGELRQLESIQPVLVDLLGHGASAGPGRKTIAEYALDIVALMDALEVESAVVLGHSMGGAIAQWLALEFSARVKAMVLIGTGAQLPVHTALITGIIDDSDTTINSIVRWMWAKGVPPAKIQQSAEIMRATDPTVIQGDFIACSKFDTKKRLAEIAIPTLIVAGENDKMTPAALGEELAQGIANSELALVPHAGHMMLLEQPKRTADLIDKWLARSSCCAADAHVKGLRKS